MSKSHLSQRHLIKVINEYLEWNNLPLQWNQQGVCHGLSIINAKYKLEGKENLFYDMLNKISTMTDKETPETNALEASEDIDHFISQVILAFRPDKFDKQYSQNDSYKMVKAGDSSLDSNFHLAIVTTAENWEVILRDDINMQENETFLVSSPGHAVNVHRSDGQYTVYDPNYDGGKKFFDNEKELIQELRLNVFPQYENVYSPNRALSENVGLSFKNLTTDELRPDISRRSAKDIYKDYFKQENVTKNFFDTRVSYGSAYMATQIEDENFIRYFIDEFDLDKLILQQMQNFLLNKDIDQTFKIVNDCILDKLSSDDKQEEISRMLHLSIYHGSPKVFNMIKSFEGKESYSKHFESEKSVVHILKHAASGGQPDILKQIINDAKQSDFLVGTLIQHSNAEQDILKSAVESNSSEAVSILLKELHKADIALPMERVSGYLENAISKNNVHMVDSLLKQLEAKDAGLLLGQMKMSIKQAKQTNLHILQSLEEKGAHFSSGVSSIVQKKSTHQLSSFKVMGLKIASFVEFVKDMMGMQDHLSISQNRVKDFKSKLRDIRTEQSSEADDTLSTENHVGQPLKP